jgi:hypothetical protein
MLQAACRVHLPQVELPRLPLQAPRQCHHRPSRGRPARQAATTQRLASSQEARSFTARAATEAASRAPSPKSSAKVTTPLLLLCPSYGILRLHAPYLTSWWPESSAKVLLYAPSSECHSCTSRHGQHFVINMPSWDKAVSVLLGAAIAIVMLPLLQKAGIMRPSSVYLIVSTWHCEICAPFSYTVVNTMRITWHRNRSHVT